ncbi:alpha/beta hydrolase fold domain-containing protein [Pacificibacter marinus]|uniref:alpha/beta hydrolase fold domain-containing protein n=1 Tax=Pacificibacter marinus TaxID=658057 RepID=UPI001C075B6C|nr:alpha/beta hydrolase fold domain-containing protein [Pacificibacter marinus]MBU2865371.1 alpha/beta hydrolase [Pacificibacter marinus]
MTETSSKRPDPALLETSQRFSAPNLVGDAKEDMPMIRKAARKARAGLVGRLKDQVEVMDIGALRRFLPKSVDRSAVIIYAHGGGWVTGDTITHGGLMTDLAALTGYEVLGPEYPLAPEHPYPAGLDHLMQLIDDTIRTKPHAKIILAGDSAGANLALGAALRLRDDGRGDVISALLLWYGCYRRLFDTTSHKAFGAGDHGLTTEAMARMWDWYLGDHSDPKYGDLSKSKLHDLPPAYLCEAELDCLASDTKWLAGELAQAGVRYTYIQVKDVPHGFAHFGQFYAPSFNALEQAAHFLKGQL